MAGRAGERYGVDLDQADTHGVLMEGRVTVSELGLNLSIHTGDTVEVQSACIDTDVAAGLTVSLLLEGRIDATLDEVSLGALARTGPVGQVWFHRGTARLRRRVCPGSRVRKVHVSITPSSLDRLLGGIDGSLTECRHREWLRADRVSRWTWIPSHHAARLAESILDAERAGGVLRHLATGVNGLAILQEALGQVLDRPRVDERPVDTRDADRAYRARRYILARLDADMTLPAIASATGMSVSTLQRVFRNTLGRTVFEFIRAERLDAARASLCRGEITVSEAAYRAGYRSASNFSTAFRHEFGFPPSHCRQPARGRTRR